MIHRPGALTQVEHRRQRVGDVGFGAPRRLDERESFGKVGGDRAGEGAARSVRVGVGAPFAFEPDQFAMGVQEVVGVVGAVPAFQEDGAAIGVADLPRRGDHVLFCFHVEPGEDLRFGDVRGNERREREQVRDERLDGVVLHQGGAGRRDHDGVDDHVRRLVISEPVRDDADELAGGNHADFDGVGPNVLKDRVDLLLQKLGRRLLDSPNAGRVLRRQRRDCAHAVDAVHRHRLQVRLNPGASAAVAARDRQYFFHGRRSVPFLVVVVTLAYAQIQRA